MMVTTATLHDNAVRPDCIVICSVIIRGLILLIKDG